MIPARGARDINPTLGFFVLVRGSQKGRFMPGTCDMPLSQMNVRTALAAIGRLNGFRFPLKVVAVGALNLDPRFCSHSELLTVQFTGCIRRTHFRSSKSSSCSRLSLLETIIEQRSSRIESNCLKETACHASLLCVVTREATYNISGSAARISPQAES
jgi:hypothetical protein